MERQYTRSTAATSPRWFFAVRISLPHVGGPDLDQTKVDLTDWQDYVRESQNSLRVIAELTGGMAVVNQNDFDKALKRIDAETSDYYVLGYYSSNPDPLKKRRNIEIKVSRAGRFDLKYKTSYTLRPPLGSIPIDRTPGRPPTRERDDRRAWTHSRLIIPRP